MNAEVQSVPSNLDERKQDKEEIPKKGRKTTDAPVVSVTMDSPNFLVSCGGCFIFCRVEASGVGGIHFLTFQELPFFNPLSTVLEVSSLHIGRCL